MIRRFSWQNINWVRSANFHIVRPSLVTSRPPGRPCLSFSPLVLSLIKMRAVFAALAVFPALALGMWITPRNVGAVST